MRKIETMEHQVCSVWDGEWTLALQAASMGVCSTSELQVLWSRKWKYSWIFPREFSCYLFTTSNL